MSLNVGTLFVQLRADTAAFRKGMADAQASLASVKASSSGAADASKSLGAAVERAGVNVRAASAGMRAIGHETLVAAAKMTTFRDGVKDMVSKQVFAQFGAGERDVRKFGVAAAVTGGLLGGVMTAGIGVAIAAVGSLIAAFRQLAAEQDAVLAESRQRWAGIDKDFAERTRMIGEASDEMKLGQMHTRLDIEKRIFQIQQEAAEAQLRAEEQLAKAQQERMADLNAMLDEHIEMQYLALDNPAAARWIAEHAEALPEFGTGAAPGPATVFGMTEHEFARGVDAGTVAEQAEMVRRLNETVDFGQGSGAGGVLASTALAGAGGGPAATAISAFGQGAAAGGPIAGMANAAIALALTSDGAQEAMAELNDIFGELAEALGAAFEVVSPLLRVVSTVLTPVFRVLGDVLEGLGEVIQFVIGEVEEVIVDAGEQLSAAGITISADLAKSLGRVSSAADKTADSFLNAVEGYKYALAAFNAMEAESAVAAAATAEAGGATYTAGGLAGTTHDASEFTDPNTGEYAPIGGGIPGFAEGGFMGGTGLAMLHGPEFIIPAEKMGGFGGNTFVISNPDPYRVVEIIERYLARRGMASSGSRAGTERRFTE